MSGDLLVGAARLSLEPPLDLPLVGFVRQTHDATGYGKWGARDLGHRARAGRPAGRALRRRHRRHRRAGDHVAPRPRRRRDRGRPGRNPRSTGTTRTSPSSVGAWGESAPGRPSPSVTRASGGSPTSSRTRSSSSAGSRSSLEPARPVWGVGVRRPGGQPPRAHGWAGRRSSAGIPTTSSTTMSRPPVPPAGRERRRDRRQLRLPSRHDRTTTCTSTRPTSPDRCATSSGSSRAGRRVPPGGGGQRASAGRVHRRRGRGRACGPPARDRGAPLARGPLRAPPADGLTARAIDHADLVVPA